MVASFPHLLTTHFLSVLQGLQGQTKEGLYKVKQNRGPQGLTRAQTQGDFMENSNA